MPPLPGKVQALPIKVLYTIDTSPQSFSAVLPEKQDVYVWPSAGGELVGSCAVKALARAICFASPECVPNKTSLDFSVYNLDPVPRALNARAFPAPAPIPASWTGKGFLSWALAEPGAGSTLARGRLVREYEFAASAFAEGGGLAALMAAANSAGDEERDGRGWGLEISLTLRQLNPEGKVEFTGRKAFENMLAEGKSSASVPISVTSPGRPRVASDRGFIKPSAPPPKPTSSPLRHTTTLPPMHASNSQPTAGPSRTIRSTPAAPPPPLKSAPSSQEREAPGSPTPTRRARDRTPPPRPIDPSLMRTPQPSPTRGTLLKLLKSEGKMSPEMAKRLANNGFIQKLMKALPPTDPESVAAVLSPSKALRAIMSPSNGRSHPHSDPASSSAMPASDASWAPVRTPTEDSATECCHNCGGTDSSGQWMEKKLKEGGTWRVCNPCGVYFNKHKRMRPQDQWANGGLAPSAPMGVRSSPRLNRVRQDPPPPPPSGPAESPRKRQRTKPVPTPSPRMATRASAREAEKGEPGSPTPGGIGKQLDYASHFPFGSSRSGSAANTPRANAAANGHGTPTAMNGVDPSSLANPFIDPNATATAEELESLFLQFADDDTAPAPPSAAVSLESLFGDGDTEGIMELLRSIEASSDPPSQG